MIRLDGPDGPATPPPAWATLDVLEESIRQAVATVHLTAPGEEVIGRRYDLRFGKQLGIRPIDAFGPGQRVTSSAVAGYIAKYATKGAESAGAVDHRIRHASQLDHLPVRDHVLTCCG